MICICTSTCRPTTWHQHSCFVVKLVYINMQDVRRKAARLVAAKCTLAARVDSFHESQDGSVGESKYLSFARFVCRLNNDTCTILFI